MELTIQIPWLSRMRRMAIGLSLVLVLVALALPASAAPPDGVSGEVTVVNEPTNPVPVTVENEVAVTGGNNTPVNVSGEVTVGNVDPIEVSGDVNATVQGAVDVNGQTYDTAGNLNVHVAQVPGSNLRAYPGRVEVRAPHIDSAPFGHISAIRIDVRSTPGSNILAVTLSGPSGDNALRLQGLREGDEVFYTFPSPIVGVDSIGISCGGTLGTECLADITVMGY